MAFGVVRSKKLKIVHLVSDLGIGGAQKVALDICSSADLEKYDVSIVTIMSRVELLSSYELDPRVKVKVLSCEVDPDFSHWGYAKRTFRPSVLRRQLGAVIDVAAAIGPDLVHCHLVPRELDLGVAISRRAGCELLYTQHQPHFGRKTLGTVLTGTLLRANYRKYNLIAVSQAVSEEIRRYDFLGKNKQLFLIENKLNLGRYKAKPKPKSGQVKVVYVARIARLKGHDDLISAWGRLAKDGPNVRKLLLVGPDEMGHLMHKLADELGVGRSIEFVGPSLSVTDILNDADVAVFPSHQEGLPISLLEKMAMGLPVLVSDIPALTAVVQDNVNGLVFKCGDADDLAQKLGQLIADSCLRRRLGEAARLRVEERFGSFNIASASEAAYQQIFSNES